MPASHVMLGIFGGDADVAPACGPHSEVPRTRPGSRATLSDGKPCFAACPTRGSVETLGLSRWRGSGAPSISTFGDVP